MEEVAETLRELGVEPLMTNATVKRQREMGEIGQQQGVRSVLDKDRAAVGARSSLDVIRNQFAQKPRAIIDSV
jgi:hypothetical protein